MRAEPVLIAAVELAELIESLGASGSGDGSDRPVLADVRWSLGGPPGRPEFEAGHLPGAQFVDLKTELSDPEAGQGGRHPLPRTADFEAAMRRIGVGDDRLVVVYDQATSLAASRLWWLLTDAGHHRVRVLDGGFDAWVAAGGAVETGPGESAEPGDFMARPGHRARTEAADLVRAIEAGRVPQVVDVRAHERYTGASEPMDPVAGHIPGAVSAPSAANQHPDGRFLDPEEIRERYRALDEADPGDGPVFYCGSGITAAQTLLARESAGLTNGSIYPGSWSDWVSDPDRPVETGDGPRY